MPHGSNEILAGQRFIIASIRNHYFRVALICIAVPF
jgi:hypothetical protein